jgi:hypothetical protein
VSLTKLALILTTIGLLWFYPVLLFDSSMAYDVRGYDWYSSQAPIDPGKLSDEGLQPAQDQTNGLWIVDSTEANRNTSLEIPGGSWARLKLVPAASGGLNVYCQYPTGSTDLLLTGHVE